MLGASGSSWVFIHFCYAFTVTCALESKLTWQIQLRLDWQEECVCHCLKCKETAFEIFDEYGPIYDLSLTPVSMSPFFTPDFDWCLISVFAHDIPSHRHCRFDGWYFLTDIVFVVNELPKALTMEPAAFQDRYQFSKPGVDDVVVTTCRTSKRAIWAAQLLIEAGYTKVFVHHTGSYGWRFSPSVKPYDSYDLGDEIPQPKSFSREIPDASAGLRELEDLGLLGMSKNDSARSSIHLSADVIQDATQLEDPAIVYFTPTSPVDHSSD